jgi:hypothetical protein
MKPGRNDPCPCGSGKKYKQCCLERAAASVVDQIPLPALNGRTPLEAIKDADGREMVEALITQFERDASAMQVPVSSEVFATLRRRLGLKPAAPGTRAAVALKTRDSL